VAGQFGCHNASIQQIGRDRGTRPFIKNNPPTLRRPSLFDVASKTGTNGVSGCLQNRIDPFRVTGLERWPVERLPVLREAIFSDACDADWSAGGLAKLADSLLTIGEFWAVPSFSSGRSPALERSLCYGIKCIAGTRFIGRSAVWRRIAGLASGVDSRRLAGGRQLVRAAALQRGIREVYRRLQDSLPVR